MAHVGKAIGILAGIASICLWAVLIFFNPYSKGAALSGETLAMTLIMLVFPAIVSIIAAFFNKPFYMLGAFIWALPMSFYTVLTPSIFKLFGVTCLLYFASFLLLYFSIRRNRAQHFAS